MTRRDGRTIRYRRSILHEIRLPTRSTPLHFSRELLPRMDVDRASNRIYANDAIGNYQIETDAQSFYTPRLIAIRTMKVICRENEGTSLRAQISTTIADGEERTISEKIFRHCEISSVLKLIYRRCYLEAIHVAIRHNRSDRNAQTTRSQGDIDNALRQLPSGN